MAMSTGTKAKAFRVVGYIAEVKTPNGPGWVKGHLNAPGLFIPDGAPIPLPADVRRVLRLVMREYRHAQKERDVACIKAGRQGDLWSACEQHERAEKRRKAGGR